MHILQSQEKLVKLTLVGMTSALVGTIFFFDFWVALRQTFIFIAFNVTQGVLNFFIYVSFTADIF